ncbi:MAG TPA: alpha/beta fold hydrolase [Steroidobacteraceae bacterium]|nr:alpha/beta fold hydrolase [Steroidobacteraceae bacterium]
MRRIFLPARGGAVARTHLVLLPGAYQAPEDVLKADFPGALRQREIDADLSCVDVEPESLTDRGVLRRLRDEIVGPSRALGYAEIWLVGISLGGRLALDYLSSYPQAVDGICLLAPYVGNRIVAGEIARAGGLAAWLPGELAPDDDERRIWAFIKALPESPLRVYLGFGREDRFAESQALMAAALPPAACTIIDGAHDWGTWRRLWEVFLESGEV